MDAEMQTGEVEEQDNLKVWEVEERNAVILQHNSELWASISHIEEWGKKIIEVMREVLGKDKESWK